MNYRLLRIAWVVAIALVAVAMVMPTSPPENMPSGADKLFHTAYYLLLGLLAVLAQREMRAAAMAGASMLALGIATELVQALLPWRSFEWLDMAANGTGVVLGIGLALLLRRWRPQPVRP